LLVDVRDSTDPLEYALGELRRIPQPVEKVGVGPVGGTREPENKAKTLQKQRIQSLNRGHKRARRGFSTG
jgi:hypothetical protein